MGMINRFTEIMNANVNSVLSKAEEKNADKLLEKYLRDQKQNLQNAKAEVGGIMAEETAAKRRLDECIAQMSKYENYATQALKENNESDARRFLEAKAEASGKKGELETAYQFAAENSGKMKKMIVQLQDDVHEAEAKIQDLKVRLAGAKIQERTQGISDSINNSSGLDDLCDMVEKRIDTAQALTDLNAEESSSDLKSLESKYEQAIETGGSDIESELNRLKSQLNQAE